MTELTESHRDALTSLCRRFAVRRLDLFGSAATGSFDPQRSDLDFLVQFDPPADGMNAFDQYFGLKEWLVALFGRRVDLVDATAMRNPFFVREVERTKVRLYAA